MIRFRLKKLDVRGAAAKSGRLQEAVIAVVAKRAQTDTEDYVPYLSGELSDSARLTSNFERAQLVWDTPYARAQYYGYPRKNQGRESPHHPLATMNWFEHSKTAHFRSWLRAAQETADRVSRGR